MPLEKIITYLFLSILSATATYLAMVLLIFFRTETRKMKIICLYSILASLVYITGITTIFAFRNSTTIFPIAGIVYSAKFILETQISNRVRFSEKNYFHYYSVLAVLVSISLVLYFAGAEQRLVFTLVLVCINLVVGIGWLREKDFNALSANSLLSIALLGVLHDPPALGVLASLIPHGVGLVIIMAKDYVQTGRSLEVLKSNKEAIVESRVKQFKEFLFLMINRIESRYSSRAMHSFNVVNLSEGIAKELGLEDKTIELIKEGSVIHDIGFLGIDHRNLPGRRVYEEDDNIIKHIWVGKNILEKSNLFIKYLPMVLYHHERMDGSGPEKMAGNAIPLPVRILIVADKFERLVNGRDSEKLSIRETITYLKKNSRKLYDPEVVKALERYVRKRFTY